MSYFEFLPVDESNNNEIVELVNNGRYSTGDGFYNSAPQFKFVRRKNIVLSIDLEATTEEDISKALNRAAVVLEASDLMLMGFTCYADISTVPGHYVFFFWELKEKTFNSLVKPDSRVMMECCYVIEKSFNVL
ncbi:hypothetical protein YC2023_075197 [Brassica napus]